MCFLSLQPENTPINSGKITDGLYAVVRSFENPVVPLGPSRIIFKGSLEDSFFFYNCEAINGTVAVVPDIIRGGNNNEQGYSLHESNFFVVKNREYWLSLFYEVMHELCDG